MNAVSAAPRAPHAGSTFHFVGITRRAEKQLLKLSKTDRRKVARALSGTVQVGRCRKLETLGNPRAFRLRIDESLRATFQLEDHGAAYVVHVGNHPSYERFLTCTRGDFSAQSTPILESSVIREATASGPSRS